MLYLHYIDLFLVYCTFCVHSCAVVDEISTDRQASCKLMSMAYVQVIQSAAKQHQTNWRGLYAQRVVPLHCQQFRGLSRSWSLSSVASEWIRRTWVDREQSTCRRRPAQAWPRARDELATSPSWRPSYTTGARPRPVTVLCHGHSTTPNVYALWSISTSFSLTSADDKNLGWLLEASSPHTMHDVWWWKLFHDVVQIDALNFPLYRFSRLQTKQAYKPVASRSNISAEYYKN